MVNNWKLANQLNSSHSSSYYWKSENDGQLVTNLDTLEILKLITQAHNYTTQKELLHILKYWHATFCVLVMVNYLIS